MANGYTPADNSMTQWNKPGGGTDNIDNLNKKVGSAWQAYIQSLYMNQFGGYDLPPLDPNLTTASSKLAQQQFMINQVEKENALRDRERAVQELMSVIDNPAFQQSMQQVMDRFENPDLLGQQYYDNLYTQQKESNARALQDELELIQNNMAGRGLGSSGLNFGLQQRAQTGTQQRNLAARRDIGQRQAENIQAGASRAYDEAQGLLGQLTGVQSQIADLYGGAEYVPTDLSGMASALDTKIRGFKPRHGFYD